eukprot:TRINITY_DN14561_c0_g1_i1.p1 TRINITY_DN14561_c0_g1~~TRINITY_DN14561_c0_g1_i1.p1  ORF type:complete len:375 (+),score=147.59 TRINITY_DN14561_c0_g1_i1:77-1201(+)
MWLDTTSMLSQHANPPPSSPCRVYRAGRAGFAAVRSPRADPLLLPVLSREPMGTLLDGADSWAGSFSSRKSNRSPGFYPIPPRQIQSPLEAKRSAQEQARAARVESDRELSRWAAGMMRQSAERRQRKVADQLANMTSSQTRLEDSQRSLRMERAQERRRVDEEAAIRRQREHQHKQHIAQVKRQELGSQQADLIKRQQVRKEEAAAAMQNERQLCSADRQRLRDEYVRQVATKQRQQAEQREQREREIAARQQLQKEQRRQELSADSAEAQTLARATIVSDQHARAKRIRAVEIGGFVFDQIKERCRRTKQEKRLEMAEPAAAPTSLPGSAGEPTSTRAIPRRPPDTKRAHHPVPQSFTDHRGAVLYRWGFAQ